MSVLDQKSKNISLIIIGLGLILYLLVLFVGPVVISHLYKDAAGSLDYYQGLAEDIWFGPIKSVIAGAVFLWICVTYLKESTSFAFGVGVLIYLILTRPFVLLNPPYADVFTGPFSDAIWLIRHNFDYATYLQQTSFTLGGPKVYPTSIFPTILAILMKISPTPQIFLFICHFLTFAMAAAIAALFREMLKLVLDSRLATIGAVILIAIPLFQSMVELINMEMACVFFAILSLHWLLKHRFALAAAAAILSLLIKAPGAIACATVFAMSLIYFLITSDKKKGGLAIVWGLVSMVCVGLGHVLREALIQQETTSNTVSFLAGWPVMYPKKYFWLFLILLSIFIGRLIVEFLKKKNWREILERYYPVLGIFTITSCWFLLYLNFASLIYRYELLLLPFYIFCIFYILQPIVTNQKVLTAMAISAVIVFLAGSHGLIYFQKDPGAGSNSYERSLEYRNDLKVYVDLAKEIDRNYATYTIGAPVIVAQLLNFYEVGYVKNKLDVIIYGVPSPHEGIRPFQGLQQLDVNKTIWTATRPDFEHHNFDGYPIGPQDLVLKTIEAGDKYGKIFKGGQSIEKMRVFILMLKQKMMQNS